MHQIQVQVLQIEIIQRTLQRSGYGVLVAMTVIPQLARYPEMFSGDAGSLDAFRDTSTDRFFVSVDRRTIDMAVTSVDRERNGFACVQEAGLVGFLVQIPRPEADVGRLRGGPWSHRLLLRGGGLFACNDYSG